MDLKTISRSNFAKMCRICLKLDENLSSETDSEIFNKLRFSIGVLILRNDNLPKSFCQSCMENINIMYEFKQLCIYSQQILNKALRYNILDVVASNSEKVPLEDSSRETEIKQPNNLETSPRKFKIKRKFQRGGILNRSKVKKSSSSNILENSSSVKEKSELTYDRSCPVCGKTFPTKYKVKLHLETHTPLEQRLKPCPYCGKGYTEGVFKKHIKKHENAELTNQKKPKQLCKLCNKYYAYIQGHMAATHAEKNYQCPECDKKFGTRHILAKHIKSIHQQRTHNNETNRIEREKAFLCPQCGKIFRTDTYLQNHISVVHEGKKMFKCKFCDREFNFRRSVWLHQNKYHFNNIKLNFNCSVCNKKFPSSSEVKRHMVVHTREQPYSCTVCERRFSHKAALRCHLKLVHKYL